MAIELISQGAGKPIIVNDLLAKYGTYKVGRWARDPDGGEPDRCYWCPLSDIKPAVGYVVREGWRYGYCAKHRRKGGTRCSHEGTMR